MQPTENTPALFAYRCLNVVPKSIEAMKPAIRNTDFEQFAADTMVDSSKFCAVRPYTTPSIFYVSGIPRATIRTTEALNVVDGSAVGAHTPTQIQMRCRHPEKDEERVLGSLGVFLAPKVEVWDSKKEKFCAGGTR